MDSTSNDENTQGGGHLPVTPQHFPGHLNPGPFAMQAAAYQQAAAFGLPGGFNGLMPSSDPRLSTFSHPQMGTAPPFSFPHGLPTPGETPVSRGKRPRVDHSDGTFDINTDGLNGPSDRGLLEQFKKLREDHDALREDHDALQQKVDALEAALSAGERETATSTEDAASKRIPKLEQLVHEYAFQLMGITKKRSPSASTSMTPESVEASGVAPGSHLEYILPESGGYLAGNPELKIPNWTVPRPNTDTANTKFQQAILQLIKNNNKETIEEYGWSDDTIMQRVKSAFKTLVGHYKKQTDANAREKAQLKGQRSKIQARQKSKFERRLNAFSEFEKRHGEEATKGYRQLIQKGAMSSEDETPGKADKETWTSKAGELRGTGNINVWETHRLLWRDVKLVQLYYALDKIAFQELKTTVNSQRFHGFKENDNKTAPKQSAKNWRLYDCMVSKGWAKASHDNTPTMCNPPGYSGNLVIADDELYPADREEIALLESYYGDDEMEG